MHWRTIVWIGLVTALGGGSWAEAQMSQQWIRRYNGSANLGDEATAVRIDAAGNTYVTGHQRELGQGYNIVTRKFNREGTLLWTTIYNGPGNGDDFAYDLELDLLGGVYVVGTARGATGQDAVVLKYNTSGSLIWDRIYAAPGNTADGLVRLHVHPTTGRVTAVGSAGQNILVLAYSAGGTLIFDHIYDRAGASDAGLAIDVDPAGFAYITGRATGTSADIVVLRIHANGSLTHAAFFDGPVGGFDEGRDIRVTNDHVFVTGTSTGVGSGRDYLTLKLTHQLTTVWTARYNGPGNGQDEANSLAVDRFGRVYVTGGSLGTGTGLDIATLCYSPQGQLLFDHRYNGPGNLQDVGAMLVLDTAGNPFVAGYSVGAGTFEDMLALKFTPNLQLQFQFRYDGPSSSNDYATAIAVGTGGEVAIAGASRGVNTFEDYTVVGYHQTYLLTGSVQLGQFVGNPNQMPVTFHLTPPGVVSALLERTTLLNPAGQYSLALPFNGVFDVYAKAPNWLRRIATNVSIGSASGTANFALINGDVNGDNVIDIQDFLALRNAFGSQPGAPHWNLRADLDGNGTVGVSDFLILRGNFGLSGDG